MKQLFLGILILAVLLINLREWVAISTFKMEQSVIAEKLCVNKNEPRSSCHGQCFLSGLLLDLHDDNTSQKGTMILDMERQLLICQSPKPFSIRSLPEEKPGIPHYNSKLTSGYAHELLDPPRALPII
ncbi:MAG: hypothetical protein R3275_04490 [Saprospiraceae bacterium]|nr:hypothetical protein [Saprospiraceae bacterium]